MFKESLPFLSENENHTESEQGLCVCVSVRRLGVRTHIFTITLYQTSVTASPSWQMVVRAESKCCVLANFFNVKSQTAD